MNASFRRDQSGVSTVIGAILVAAMIATVFAHIQLYHVPVWEARAEAEHSDEVVAALAAFRGAIISAGDSGASVVMPAKPSSGILAPALAAPASTRFQPAAAPLNVSLDHFLPPPPANVTTRGAWDESWTSGYAPITDVFDVFNFRLRIASIGGQDPGFVRVIAQDASGRYVGNFTVDQQRDPPMTNVFIEVTDGQNVVHYDNPTATHLTNTISPYWIDMMDPTYRYDGIINRASKPITFTIQEAVLDADHSISYSTMAPNGTTSTIGGAGVPQEVDLTFAGGRLEHDNARTRLVPQRWIMEHGALILAQSDGVRFHVPPPLSIDNVSGVLQLGGSLPVFEGGAGTLGTSGAARIEAHPVAGQVWSGKTARIDLNLTSEFPPLWRSFFDERFAGTGANHTVTLGADWVRLQVHGPSGDPNVADLLLSLHLPRYRIVLGG